MRVTSAEETLWYKEDYEHLAVTHEARVCPYKAENRGFAEPQFK